MSDFAPDFGSLDNSGVKVFNERNHILYQGVNISNHT